MGKESINIILSQIEDNLQSLDSARNQVERVTKSNKELSKHSYALSESVKELANKVEGDTSKLMEVFSIKLNVFEERYNKALLKSTDSIGEEIEKFRESSLQLKLNAEGAINQVRNLSIESIEENNEKSIKRLLSTSNSIKKEIGGLSNTIESKTGDLLNEFSGDVKDVTSKFKEDSSTEIKKIKTKIEEFEKASSDLEEGLSNYLIEFKKVLEVSLEKQLSINEISVNNIVNLVEDKIEYMTDRIETNSNSSLDKYSLKVGEFEMEIKDISTKVVNNIQASVDKSKTLQEEFIEGANKLFKELHLTSISAITKQESNMIDVSDSLGVKIIELGDVIKKLTVLEIVKDISEIKDNNLKMVNSISQVNNSISKLNEIEKTLVLHDKSIESIKSLLYIVISLLGVGGITMIYFLFKYL